jgi:hypothetical protein
LGLAITQWATVEHAFQHVYSSSFKHYDIANAASFYAIENFRSKLQVASAALARNLKPEFVEEWGDLHNRLRARNTKRNALAHRRFLNRPNNKPGRRILLIPSGMDPNDETPAYGVKNLVLIRYAFYGLSNELLNFADRLTGAKAPFSVPHGQLERPPDLRTLVRQMREDTEPPHRPLRG